VRRAGGVPAEREAEQKAGEALKQASGARQADLITDEEMSRIAIEISQRKIKEDVPRPCPNAAPNPGVYFGAMHAMMHLRKTGRLK
jgi:hypothetical protein